MMKAERSEPAPFLFAAFPHNSSFPFRYPFITPA